MLTALILLTLVSQIPYIFSIPHTCIPNSRFRLNDRIICYCDATGRWSQSNCQAHRRNICQPGQIIWQGCNQCVCQDNGSLTCSNILCGDDGESRPSHINKLIDVTRLWCIPFMSYYTNCSLCVCPASGKMVEARCATDAKCPFRGSIDYLTAIKNNVCIPKVVYLLPCFHCQCSDDGYFIAKQCVEICHKIPSDDVRRCTAKTFYRKDCNICFCPSNGLINEKMCSKENCVYRLKLTSLASLRNKTRRCTRQTFTEQKCFYCECSSNGTVNINSCLESECMSIDNFKNTFEETSCIPGEMVPKCSECFCPQDGYTDSKYCSKFCSHQHKLAILEIATKDMLQNPLIIDRNHVKHKRAGELCEPNTIYESRGRYCVCPGTGDTKLHLCTSEISKHVTEKPKSLKHTADIDFNMECAPNTFVDFGCNTCYCLKNGRIDPKWCTYDDCEAKQAILERHNSPKSNEITPETNGTCIPGSISKAECNFCICPDSGRLEDRTCTKNSCDGVHVNINPQFTCEPLSYYNVDCNICMCPKNGLQNVAQCTKNSCEKHFLRSEVCVPGKLFSVDCNVCVCPPNGNNMDRVCTNTTCENSDTPWKKIFHLSHNLLSYQKLADTTRNLELCFPGEEFDEGCKVCLCPDMGLRMFATCAQMLCNEEKNYSRELANNKGPTLDSALTRRKVCNSYNSTSACKPKKCTPGSMYIIECKQCICPYLGDINAFCRPLPKNMECEQAFAHVKIDTVRRGKAYGLEPTANTQNDSSIIPRPHATWACDTPGQVMDSCFICECETGTIIEEHCFQSDDPNCLHAIPSFLKDIKLPDV